MKIIDFESLIKELDKHKFKQLHIHHTWKPTHRSFKGNNHIQLQQSMKNHHINVNKWSDIGQHLSLFPDGKWVTGRPFNIAPASISGWNTGALAVEVIGNFDKVGSQPYNDLGYDELEGEQKKSILKLIKYFIDKYGEDSIKFHREGPGVTKSCPGSSINKVTLINEAKDINKKEDASPYSSWAVEAMEWGMKNNLTDGSNPKSNLTLERFITILYRYDKARG